MISVIIPTYNRSSTILRAAKSVLQQSLRDLELIIVDDCSSDNTEAIVKGIKDDRLRFYRLDKNVGACAARNKGVELARGEYIAFQDSDDEWLSNKLEIQLNLLKSSGADVCFCSLDNIGLNGNHERIPSSYVKSETIQKMLLSGNFISTQTILGKAECFRDVMFDERFPRYQDWDLAIRLSRKYIIVHCDKILVKMYKQTDSITFDSDKTARAMELIIEKYGKSMGHSDLAMHYFKMGKNLLACGKKASSAFKKALNLDFKIKYLVYYFYSLVRVHRIRKK